MDKLHHLRHHRPLHVIGIYICLLSLLIIVYSAVLHDIPFVINHEMFPFLHMTQQNINNLHHSYQYYLIAFMVLSGLVVDIVGPRAILVMSLVMSLIANYIFIYADSISVSLTSRLVINVAHIFIIVSVLTLGTHWLPRRHFSLFVGLLTCVLIVTPIVVFPYLYEIFIRETLQGVSWAFRLSGILLILGLLVTRHFADNTRHKHTLEGLVAPLTHHKIWLLGFVAMLGWISNTAALSFGTFYMIKRFHIDPANAIDMIGTASIYFGLGAIFMGLLSDCLDGRRYLLSICYILAAACFSLLIFIPALSQLQSSGLLLATVFFTSSIIICYRKANDYCTLGNSGITMGFILSVSIIGSILFSHQMSLLLYGYANAGSSTNILSWQLVLVIVPVLLLLGSSIAAFLIQPPPLKPIVILPIVLTKKPKMKETL